MVISSLVFGGLYLVSIFIELALLRNTSVGIALILASDLLCCCLLLLIGMRLTAILVCVVEGIIAMILVTLPVPAVFIVWWTGLLPAAAVTVTLLFRMMCARSSAFRREP